MVITTADSDEARHTHQKEGVDLTALWTTAKSDLLTDKVRDTLENKVKMLHIQSTTIAQVILVLGLAYSSPIRMMILSGYSLTV